MNTNFHYRDVHAPLIREAAARAGAVDHDLALTQRKRPAIEQTAGAEPFEDARNARERGEQRERRYSGRQNAIEDGLPFGRIRCCERFGASVYSILLFFSKRWNRTLPRSDVLRRRPVG